ncbi:hypothetical protein GCM10025865_02390 [Paraoerskovia sediminicola]|uniref:Uncharacterized protein n=1 Tax=Paraoerskovia sediminicola TaxID=1138587 RepID=A0ABN6X822_9CELL|nr:hypothetical protein [Paraoerskovia sediminicola]BDZ40940.1 hypothetical protein GCM10025865_02390 [Paraoerskovia sediminicola]
MTPTEPGTGTGTGTAPGTAPWAACRVGERVVVRHRSPAPGPPMTDLLGTVVRRDQANDGAGTSADPGDAVVVVRCDAGARAGQEITVPLSDVITSKVIPPRPTRASRRS